MNGWIKLHRKIWDSQNFKHRKNIPNLITVWIWLLTHANADGVVTFGRNQISQDTGIHPSSVKRVIEHLQSNMSNEVTYEATKLFSKITILNWSKYQSKTTNKPTNKRPITDLQPTTNKNKEVRIKNTITNVIGSEPQTSYGSSDVNAVMEKLYTYLDVKPVRIQKQRIAASNLIRRHGLDTTLSLIDAYKYLQQSDIYTVKVASMEDLWNKQNDILLQIKKKKSNQIARI